MSTPSIVPIIGRLWLEDRKSKFSLGYIIWSSLKKKNKFSALKFCFEICQAIKNISLPSTYLEYLFLPEYNVQLLHQMFWGLNQRQNHWIHHTMIGLLQTMMLGNLTWRDSHHILYLRKKIHEDSNEENTHTHTHTGTLKHKNANTPHTTDTTHACPHAKSLLFKGIVHSFFWIFIRSTIHPWWTFSWWVAVGIQHVCWVP